jgi:hypothetical protein
LPRTHLLEMGLHTGIRHPFTSGGTPCSSISS